MKAQQQPQREGAEGGNEGKRGGGGCVGCRRLDLAVPQQQDGCPGGQRTLTAVTPHGGAPEHARERAGNAHTQRQHHSERGLHARARTVLTVLLSALSASALDA